MKSLPFVSMILAISLAIVGCTPVSPQTASGVSAESASANSAKPSYVITQNTLYYKDSPSQPMPADGTLSAGTSVTVVKRLGNFTLIRTASGLRAYVATSAVGTTQ